MANVEEVAAAVQQGWEELCTAPVGALDSCWRQTGEHTVAMSDAVHAPGGLDALLSRAQAVASYLESAGGPAEDCKAKAGAACNLFTEVAEESSGPYLPRAIDHSADMADKAESIQRALPDMKTVADELVAALTVVRDRIGTLATIHGGLRYNSRDVRVAHICASGAALDFLRDTGTL